MFKTKIPKSKKVSSMCKKAATALLSFGTSLSLLSGVMMPSVLAAEPANFTASAYANHWGRSNLRAYLNNATKADNTLPIDTATGGTNSGNFPAKFSDKEYGLVQDYTYKTNVINSNKEATAVYETTDKFWLPSANLNNNQVTSWGSEDISAITQYSKSIAADKSRLIPISYWGYGSYGVEQDSWLRSSDYWSAKDAYMTSHGGATYSRIVDAYECIVAACKINVGSVLFTSAANAAFIAGVGGAKKFTISGSNDFGKRTSSALPDYGMYLKTKLDSSFNVDAISFSNNNLTINYTGGETDKYVVVHAFYEDDLTQNTASYAAAKAIPSADGSVTIDVTDWGIDSLNNLTLKVWMEDGSGNLAQATVPQTFVGSSSGATETDEGAKSNLRVFAMKKDLQTSWGDLSKLSSDDYNKVISGNADTETGGIMGKNPTNQKIYFGSHNGAPLKFWIAGRETSANDGEISADGDIMTLYQAKSVETKQFDASASNYTVADKPAVTLQLTEGQTAEYTGNGASYPADQITFKQGDIDLDKSTLKWLYRAPGTEAWTAGMPTLRGSYELRCYAEGTDNYERTYSAVVNFTAKTITTAEDFIFTPPENLVEDGTPKEATVTVKPEITGMGEITAIKYFDETDSQLEEPPAAAGTYQVKIDVGPGDPYTEAENLTDPSWTFTITPAPPMPADPPSNPETTPDAPTEEESYSDALKTGDIITSFTLSGLVLAMTLAPLGFIINTKMNKKKFD